MHGWAAGYEPWGSKWKQQMSPRIYVRIVTRVVEDTMPSDPLVTPVRAPKGEKQSGRRNLRIQRDGGPRGDGNGTLQFLGADICPWWDLRIAIAFSRVSPAGRW